MRRAGDLNRSFKYTGGEIERTIMTRLENAYLTVQINELGAELTGIYDKERGHETIWQANRLRARSYVYTHPLHGHECDLRPCIERKNKRSLSDGF